MSDKLSDDIQAEPASPASGCSAAGVIYYAERLNPRNCARCGKPRGPRSRKTLCRDCLVALGFSWRECEQPMWQANRYDSDLCGG
jgi:hypothetical protein